MPLLILAAIVIIAVIAYRIFGNAHLSNIEGPTKHTYDLNEYAKKPYLFDTVAEFHFFSVLEEVVGSGYRVFPQVNYSHLIVPRTGSWNGDRRYRSHIERKSADFVVCDRTTCVPRLIIDLDGSVHLRPDVQIKDREIDEILRVAGLAILRLTNEEATNRESVKAKVSAMLK